MHAHQLGQRARLHFLHDARPVDLHGALTDTEFVGNDLVRLARDDEFQHFFFAFRQFVDALANATLLLPLGRLFLRCAQRVVDAVQQLLIAKRLLDRKSVV